MPSLRQSTLDRINELDRRTDHWPRQDQVWKTSPAGLGDCCVELAAVDVMSWHNVPALRPGWIIAVINVATSRTSTTCWPSRKGREAAEQHPPQLFALISRYGSSGP